MPEFGQYRVKLLDHNAAEVIDLFPGDDFLWIQWQHVLNAPGTYSCELVAETTTKDQFEKRYQVLIERNWADDPGDWYEEFVGFHLGQSERWVENNVDEHYWQSLGMSPEWLLDQPLLQPLANSGNANWAYYDQWWQHGAADDVIKAMVGESMVSPADADRIFTQMALQGNMGEGIWSCFEGKWIRMLDAIQNAIGEDGSKGGCDFRVVRVSGGYEFRTYAPFYGTDRRRGNPDGLKPLVFSMENGNIRNPNRQVLWAEEVTAAYGGWQGGGMERSIYLEENAAALAEDPYARREGFYDLRDVTQADTIPSILQQKLIDDGEVEIVTVEILQTAGSLYGRDYGHGDLANLDLPDGSRYDVRIVEVDGRLSGDNEEQIEVMIDLWTREDSA